MFFAGNGFVLAAYVKNTVQNLACGFAMQVTTGNVKFKNSQEV